MNEPHDPNATAGIPSALTDTPHAADALDPTDRLPGPADLPAVPGYRVVREVARGGMGRILAAHDLALDRDVALKVLLPGANADRFVRESKITARLPHPGIPPVHALGTLADGSPFLAMKLIAGQTLADEMKTADRPRLLQAFTQVCQAVGFAHSRGIIHRDLKPANIMVGAFGEVQVMDWGLAKDLSGQELADELRSAEAGAAPSEPGAGTDPSQTTDHGAQGGSTAEGTQLGQVMGTPAYMAPEQARGEPTDARADVFALGGILCKILTGHPPFGGTSPLETIRRAAAADLGEAFARLDGCGADWELAALCWRCLSPNPEDRPANGQAVADSMTAYLNGVQERLHVAQRERAVAETKMAEQRKRQRLRLALAGVLVLLVGGAGFGAWKAQQIESARAAEQLRQSAERDRRRADTERNVSGAVQKVEALLAQTPGLTEEPEQWEAVLRAAFAGVEQAEGALKTGEAGEGLREQVRRVRARAEEAERVRKFVQRLDDIATAHAELSEGDRSIRAYDAAFRDFKLHPALLSPRILAERIRAHPHAEVLAAALIEWNEQADLIGKPVPGLFATVKRLWSDVEMIPVNDPGKRYATQIFRPQATAGAGTRKRPLRMADLSPRQIETVANRLLRKGLERDAGELLSAGIERHPRDFRLRMLLGYVCAARMKPPLAEHAVRNFSVAVALRPGSVAAWTNQGNALFKRGETETAKAALHKALSLNPNASLARTNLATMHAEIGEPDEALRLVNEALARDPKAAGAYYLLGNLLNRKGDKDGAEKAYRRAVELNPDDAMARGNLALLLSGKGDREAALAQLTAALKAAPKDPKAHVNLGALHLKYGEPARALEHLATAVELDPKYAKAWMNLGRARLQTGDKDGAVAALLKAAQLAPDDAGTRFSLAAAHAARKEFDKAIAEYRKAIERDPALLEAHNNLGTLLLDRGDAAGAAECFAAAVKLDPKSAAAQRNLGAARMRQNAFREALPALREAARLEPGDGWARFGLGVCLANTGDAKAAVPAFRAAVRLLPRHHLAHFNLGVMLGKLGDWRGAAEAYRGAVRVDPSHANSHASLGKALRALKDFPGAAGAFREAIRLAPDFAEAYCNLASVLSELGQFAEAVRCYAAAFAADPALAERRTAEGLRYQAACAAALAAGGKDPPPAAERARLHEQARTWLAAELALHTRRLRTGKPADRAAVRQQMLRWQNDSALAGVRDAAPLAELPADERQAFARLWADVAALRKRAQAEPE